MVVSLEMISGHVESWLVAGQEEADEALLREHLEQPAESAFQRGGRRAKAVLGAIAKWALGLFMMLLAMAFLY